MLDYSLKMTCTVRTFAKFDVLFGTLRKIDIDEIAIRSRDGEDRKKLPVILELFYFVLLNLR